ncbi:MAG: peptidoglycan DD-metalloendopeptidase family protein [Candidatus Eiseniibacteriota bacterium]
MLLAPRRQRIGAASGLALTVLSLAAAGVWSPSLAANIPNSAHDAASAPVAGAFVYPVGNELDFTKPREGEGNGYYVSDPYLARRGKKKQRTHHGVDLACGHGGAPVHAIASGVVAVADANAMIKVRTRQKIKLPVVENGQRVYKNSWRWKTTYKWRTGWGNYVVLRHTLPTGETVYSLYAHMMPKSIVLRRGDVVAAGEQIGRVGRTGRATSSHLHLEIRRAVPADPDDVAADEESLDGTAEDSGEDQVTPEVRTYAQYQTVDPVQFLERHVRVYKDLDPGTWQSRYALAACRDGILTGDKDEFDPDDSVTRGEFYRSLVLTFRLASPFTTREWDSTVDALVDNQVLDLNASRGERANDKISRSDALEILLRCLDRHQARAPNLASIDAMKMSHDFNATFAGSDAAVTAEAKAKSAATAETKARQKAEWDRVARARKAAKAQGKTSKVVVKKVPPVKPTPLVDPGFDALATSKKNLTRAESCLLFATTLRLGQERYSALERAASRVAESG